MTYVLSVALFFSCISTTTFAASKVSELANKNKISFNTYTALETASDINLNDGKRIVEDGYYKLSVLGNYLHFDSNHKGELNNKADLQKFKFTYRGDGDYIIQAENGKYVGVENFNNLKEGNRVVLTNDAFDWKLTKDGKDGLISMRMYANEALAMNASGEKKANGTPIIVWTLKGAVPNNASFHLISCDKGRANATDLNDGKRTIADGYYQLRAMYNYFTINSSNKAELNKKQPYQEFKLTYGGDGYYTIQASNGKYVGIENFDKLNDGNRVGLSDELFEWKLTQKSKSEPDIFSMRPYADETLLVNASEEKNAHGTHIIVWTHKNPAPNHASFRFIPSEKSKQAVAKEKSSNKVITADFNVYNNTGKSITKLYMVESGAEDWGDELLSKYKYKSFSNGKYIKFNFGFDKNTSYDFYMCYADGSESEAVGLSFKGATARGGVIRLYMDSVTIEMK